ncbi:protein amnionless [Monodelphis domestica]|uniref:Protein amnionless n=1 Tax=Monodelphis domestica TaxID=13616 RepID=F7DTU7_MONDO|nr:protein amnionless [Monodelphis domestica]XP_007473591.1 protein amnionless [Monodelphis domestica]XP_007473592.1 protein amnionless [Monodelphis domestica]
MEGWHSPIILLCLLFCEVSVAVYKQWIPNTNFEDAANWDRNRTPSETDIVMFDSNKMVSVFVGSTHVLMGAHLPLDGEFILAPGAGFTAFDGVSDPSSDSDHIHFLNADRFSWYNPTLWHTDLKNSDRLFSMDTELIPCRQDDVIFPPETSFRVDLGAGGRTISLHSISILDQTFSVDKELATYLASSTGKLQFHGAGSLRLSSAPCEDPSGCECGNDEVEAWICASLLQTSGGRCPKPACQVALKPVGQCCEICGAMIFLNYTQAFDLHQYKQRLLHNFLDRPQALGVRMAISKVHKEHRLRGSAHTARGKRQTETTTHIQVVLTDDGSGPEAGRAAVRVAQAILTDVAEQGAAYGVLQGDAEYSDGGSSTAGLTGESLSSGMVTSLAIAIVLGLMVVLLGGLLLLHWTGWVRLWPLSVPTLWQRSEPALDQGNLGFDNPIFDSPGLASVLAPGPREEVVVEDAAPSPKGPPSSGSYFINPLFEADI